MKCDVALHGGLETELKPDFSVALANRALSEGLDDL